MSDTKKGYVIPHTHWDREWRYPIWESRVNLGVMMDELINILETQPEYKCFMLDGQFVPIEDYLIVRPQNEARLKKLIKDKRIVIGPWYTLPDLYPISGESIVRNLLRGYAECGKIVSPLKVGYESFGWGQPSQFPQIYKGFGIDTVFVAKKVDVSRAPNCEFAWEGKDGTRVYATRLGTEARANFFMHTYMEVMHGKEYKSDEFKFGYGDGDLTVHRADIKGSEQDYFKLTNSQYIHEENLREIALKSWNAICDTLLPNNRPIMNGSDSTTAQPQLTTLIKKLNSALKADGIELVMSDIEEYTRVLKTNLKLEDLLVVKGELRDGPPMAVTGNALMTRPAIKTLNKQVQYALMDRAEPMAIMGVMLKEEYPKNYLDIAMRYMLLAHAHDSINGVTQDKTVEDVKYNLHQALEIATVIEQENIKTLAKNIDGSLFEEGEVLLLVTNPLPYGRNEVVEACVDLPRELDVWSFELFDSKGNECNVAQISRTEETIPVASLHSRPEPFYVDRHIIQFETGEVPAGGYKVLRLKALSTLPRKTEAWAPNRKTLGDEIAKSPLELENRFIKVDILGDGSIKITNKETNITYGPLNYFEDTGDIGDYWIYYPPYLNKTYTSKNKTAEIWLEENTHLQASIVAKITMQLPKYSDRPQNYVRGKSMRSEQTNTQEIFVRYTLKKDEDILRIATEINNNVSDHKTCVLFDTHIDANVAYAQGHFCVDNRNALPLQEESGKYYNEMTTNPMQDFVYVKEEDRGFAVITNSIGEYDISRKGKLSLTLMRGMKNIICTEFRSFSHYHSQHGGQSLGKLQYSYAICVNTKNFDTLSKKAKEFGVPMGLTQFCPCKKTNGTLPMEKSFYSLEGGIMSALKIGEHTNNIIARIYNPKEVSTKAVLTLNDDVQIKGVYLTNLAEERFEEIKVTEGKIEVKLPQSKIATIEIEVNQQ